MARQLYTEQLAAVEFTGGGELTVDLAEPYTWVVRDISGRINSGDTGGGYLVISGQGVGFYDLYWPGIYEGSFHWEGRVALPGPNTLVIGAGGLGGLNTVGIIVTGYRLTPP